VAGSRGCLNEVCLAHAASAEQWDNHLASGQTPQQGSLTCSFKITNWVSTTASPAVRRARKDRAANPEEGHSPVVWVANPAVG
jgi:hypothetical protein